VSLGYMTNSHNFRGPCNQKRLWSLNLIRPDFPSPKSGFPPQEFSPGLSLPRSTLSSFFMPMGRISSPHWSDNLGPPSGSLQLLMAPKANTPP